jgi:hypothetical protein
MNAILTGKRNYSLNLPLVAAPIFPRVPSGTGSIKEETSRGHALNFKLFNFQFSIPFCVGGKSIVPWI